MATGYRLPLFGDLSIDAQSQPSIVFDAEVLRRELGRLK
jgi:hypothetical protein